MPTCVPIRDMKNTASFAQLVEEATGPVTVTKNGYDAFVVMKSGEYEALQQELAQARLLARMTQAEAEYAEGRYADGRSFTERMRAEYGA